MRSIAARVALGASVLALASCGIIGSTITPASRNIVLPEGPPVEEIVTNFDQALHCLREQLPEQVTFAVGQVVDATGRESYSDGGTGRFVSQGAAEMVQSAMFRAGAAVVNRRDPAIMVTETQWGIRDIQRQIPVNFFISGSINSLDFIPGGGASLTVGGIGPRYRQNRILVGLDLSLTDAFTGRILASVPLQRQIFAQEVGVSAGRFFGDTLVSLDAGGQQREAVNFVLRQMLNLATFELLGQLVPEAQYRTCRTLVEPFTGRLESPSGVANHVIRSAVSTATNGAAEQAAAQAAGQAATPATNPTRAAAAQSVDAQALELTNNATLLAVRAISSAAEANSAETPEQRATKTAEALQLARAAVQLLQRAAELGLNGPEGDAAAVVVQRAMEEAMAAYQQMQAAVEPPAVAAPAPAVAQPNLTLEPPQAVVADPAGPAGIVEGGPGPAGALDSAQPSGGRDQLLPDGSP